jgi:outer membrane protein assembly factor BamB
LITFGESSADYQKISSDVKATIPSPGLNISGLAWDGSYLWALDDSTDSIYQLDSSTGEVMFSTKLHTEKPKGLAWNGKNMLFSGLDNKIFEMVIEKENFGLIKHVYTEPNKLNTTRFRIKAITCDNEGIWYAHYAGWSSRIIKINNNGEVIFSALGISDGLAYDGNYLWNLISTEGISFGRVYKCDLLTGKRIGVFKIPGKYPTSITFDGSCFWISDRGTKKIYRISID